MPEMRHYLLLAAHDPLGRIDLAPATDRPAEAEHLAQNRGNRTPTEAIPATPGIPGEADLQNTDASGGKF